MREQWLTSVGIDVGTSTTKMIVSKLKIARMSSPFALPRYEIVERRIEYESPIISTPLQSYKEIDAAQIAYWLEQQYQEAHIERSSVQSGAIIFTGETASKTNAEGVLHQLALDSGSFVVATAGCELEAVLAAKGSGAEAYSQQVKEMVINMDIGGGTANIAYCYRGKTLHTTTFHLGGRLLRLQPDGTLLYIAEALEPWLRHHNYLIQVGDCLSLYQLSELATTMVRSMLSYLAGDYEGTGSLLLVKQPSVIPPASHQLMVSGGVGYWFNTPGKMSLTLEYITQFGDFGPLLAHALKVECCHYGFEPLVPLQTVRATVLGAGMQSTEISGSTVYIEQGVLPIRNVPVVSIDLSESALALSPFHKNEREHNTEELIDAAFRQAAALYSATTTFAIAITGLKSCTYANLQQLSALLVSTYLQYFSPNGKLIVICENDMAKALGQSLHLRCLGQPSIVCIDQISTQHGDYVDLGEPIKGTTIPVIVKTLAF